MTKRRVWIGVGAVVLLGSIAWWWIGRKPAEADDPSAAVARVERHALASTLTISGEFKPFQEVDVHAKVAGYIRVIHVDVGDHVKEGQTLAVLEVPELAAQLAGAD